MTETSAVPLAIEAAGWSLGKMCADLVHAAAARGGRLLCERRQAPAGDRRSDKRDTPASGASKSIVPASGASKSNVPVSRRATTASASRGAARAENYLRSHGCALRNH